MMKRFFLGFAFALFIIASGCAGLNKPVEVKPTPQQILQPTIDLINYCSKDTGLNTMAYKAYFDTSTVSLVVYLGKSASDNEYKWEIPLQYIDRTSLSLFRQDYNVSTITLNVYGSQKVIKYYKANKLRSNSNQFVLYLGKCFGNNGKDEALEALMRATAAAQENIDMETIKRGNKPKADTLNAEPSANPEKKKATEGELNLKR